MKNSTLPSVFLIVLNYNGRKTLPDCLRAIYQSDYQNFEVVVVDNDSKDGSLEQARHDFSRAHFIKNSANIGFSQGNNVGIRFALEKFADFIFVLNNDAIIEKTTISRLVETANKEQKVGIVSPLILDGDKKIWFAGGKINWNAMKNLHVLEVSSNKPYATEYICGCAMLIKKEVFRKIGLFDERFFLYYEDADFSLRAKNAGFKLLIDPNIKIKHLEQSNEENGEKTYWLVFSALLFFRLHGDQAQKIWYFFYLIARKLKNIYSLLFSKNKNSKQVRKAYRDFRKISLT